MKSLITKSRHYKGYLLMIFVIFISINLSFESNLKSKTQTTIQKSKEITDEINSVDLIQPPQMVGMQAPNMQMQGQGMGLQGPPMSMGLPNPNQQNPNGPTVVNYEAIWNTMFISGSKRPGSMCIVPLNINFKPVKKPNLPPERESFLPRKKPNVFYNKPGYEDSAYLWDYLDNIFQKRMAKIFREIWQQVKSTQPNPKVNDPYSVKEQLIYYYNNGGRYQMYYDPRTETDQRKLANSLHFFNDNINPSIMLGGINISQMEPIFKKFGMIFNPGLIGWEKKKLDYFDFNGDGTLSAEEFLFLLIWENRDRLADPRLFKQICDELLDPIFDYMDCDSDGNINAEGLWVGLKELIRPTPECDMYACTNPKSKKAVRTSAVGDVVLKNAEFHMGFLTKDEWRKAVLLAYWDRQVNNNNIFDLDQENQKDMRWFRNMFDKNCYDGNGVR